MASSTQKEWEALDGARQGLLTRCEKYAGLTLPLLCPPIGYNENNEEADTDYQSLGAQCVNNLSNKLMLALFAPSRPFFRIDVPAAMKAQLAQMAQSQQGGDPSDVDNLLAVAEKNAVTVLEQNSTRPRLYLGLKHLVVTGNVMMILPKDQDQPPRMLGIRKYVVKRGQDGRVILGIIMEEVCFNELDPKVQEGLIAQAGDKYKCDSIEKSEALKCKHYIRYCYDAAKKKYKVTQAVDDYELDPIEYGSSYSEEELPYRALTWELADENNYGTGLVEQASGDLQALSTMSEATVQAAVLASEFRWLVNPAGATSVQDFLNSNNGDAIPGQQGDITPLNNGATMNLQAIDTVASKYVNRIGQLFLLLSSVIRDSERTTAVEVKAVATELETSLGGVYSRLAVDMQKPIAFWLLKAAAGDTALGDLKPVIVTGLDALSRNGDLENLQMCLQDVTQLAAIPPIVLNRLKIQPIINAIFSARGLNPNDYVLSEADAQQAQAQQMAQDATVASAPGVAQEAAKAANQPQGAQ